MELKPLHKFRSKIDLKSSRRAATLTVSFMAAVAVGEPWVGREEMANHQKMLCMLASRSCLQPIEGKVNSPLLTLGTCENCVQGKGNIDIRLRDSLSRSFERPARSGRISEYPQIVV